MYHPRVAPPKFHKPLPKLLLVDDDTILLRSLKRILEDRFQISVASSASEAMICLMQDSFEGIICDYKMTGTNGKELLKYVAQEFPQMFRVMLTGQINESDSLMLSQREKLDRVLYKPIEPEALLEEVNRLIRHRSSFSQRILNFLTP